MDIFLLKNNTRFSESYPRQIKIGLNSSCPAYFKLIRNKNILKGSIIKKGLNIIEIKATEFFQNPGTYEYTLVTKTDQTIKKKKFIITIRLIDKFEPSKIPKNNSNNMEILIPNNKKNIYQNIGPLNPISHRYENLDSINLFGIISKLIKKKKQKSLQKKLNKLRSKAARCRQMTIGFYPDNNVSQNKPIYATITINWKDLSR